MPASSNGTIRRQRVFTVPLSTNTMLLPTKIGISTHSAVAVLLFEAIDRLRRHPEEPAEPPQRMVAVGPAEEVADRGGQCQADRGDHRVGDRGDAGADRDDQVAVARGQHDQLLGSRLHPVGEDDVGDVRAHDEADEGDEQDTGRRPAADAAR